MTDPMLDRQVRRQLAILRHADTELLYDKPYEDNKRIRVTGPFTVESLSPHRVLSTDDERPRSEQEGQRDSAAGQFETMILDNLRKAGVQNTVKGERLVFDDWKPKTFQGVLPLICSQKLWRNRVDTSGWMLLQGR